MLLYSMLDGTLSHTEPLQQLQLNVTQYQSCFVKGHIKCLIRSDIQEIDICKNKLLLYKRVTQILSSIRLWGNNVCFVISKI